MVKRSVRSRKRVALNVPDASRESEEVNKSPHFLIFIIMITLELEDEEGELVLRYLRLLKLHHFMLTDEMEMADSVFEKLTYQGIRQ